MSDASIEVACLCAAWCRTCEGYQPLVRRVAASLASEGLRWHWIDVEDEADLVGDLDIETFPTWVIAGPEGLRFAGPLLPFEDTLRRTLRAALSPGSGLTVQDASAEWLAFVGRLRRQPAWNALTD